jgi:two-component system OmpR family response regulator
MVVKHLLVVDDDPQICELLNDFLSRHGYQVFIAPDGSKMKKVLDRSVIDLIILDVMMPGEDGLMLCKNLRQTSDIPILMLSAIGEEMDRIIGLEIGADDYLPKPFNPHELLARIKALLRRTHVVKQVQQMPNIRFSDWVLDQNRRYLVAQNGLTVPLSTGEYQLLLAFLEHPQRVLSRDQLSDLTKGQEYLPFDRAIDVQIGRLRKKIEKNPKNPEMIVTVHGGGYQFIPKVAYEK